MAAKPTVAKFAPKHKTQGMESVPTLSKYAPKRKAQGTADTSANPQFGPNTTKTEQALLSKKSISLSATKSLEAAKKTCRKKVKEIVDECQQENRRFRDRHFDVRTEPERCLYPNAKTYKQYHDSELVKSLKGSLPVGKLFDEPGFFKGAVDPSNVRQGAVGDCWFVAALAVAANIPGLIDSICVDRNEEVGVYGFIFYMNGNWVSVIVDDQLLVRTDENGVPMPAFGSGDWNQTWVPLLEKAYAKNFLGYMGIADGQSGEALEDLTGGVTMKMFIDDIFDKEKYWRKELMRANKLNLFSVSYEQDLELVKASPIEGKREGILDNGILSGHAYSLIEVREIKGNRLLKLKNPWGHTEWKGDWSDDSKKWTPELRAELKVEKKDDGCFWMSYADFLKSWTFIERTRLFDNTWSVISQWIQYNVTPESDGKFTLTLTKKSICIIVLQQQDKRQLSEDEDVSCDLQFKLFNEGGEDDTKNFIKRTRASSLGSGRSVNISALLEPGVYTIIPKITLATAVYEDKDFSDEAAIDQKFLASFDEKKLADQDRRIHKGVELAETLDEDGNVVETVDHDWDMLLGCRIYARDSNFTLKGEEGDYPGADDDSDSEEDPEETTVADDEAEGTENEDDEKNDDDKEDGYSEYEEEEDDDGDKGSVKGSDKGSDKGSYKGSYKGSDKGSEQGDEQEEKAETDDDE